MISPTTKNSIKSSANFRTKQCGVTEQGLIRLFYVLENSLYSDKVLAVLREYSTNAVDAHVEAGKHNEPIQVVLPNALQPELRIRDFGKGLSQEQMDSIFSNYGESTKNDSNDFVGMMGIGSKSGWAYGHTFQIASYQQGTKTIYNCYKNSKGIGCIATIGTSPTTDGDGLEVVVPAKADDFNAFTDRAEILFKWFKVKPIIKGGNGTEINLDRSVDYAVQGEGWGLTGGEPFAIMGNIGYEIKIESMKEKLTVFETEILERGIELNFNIGDIDIAASREGLQYTPKTIRVIKQRLAEATASMVKLVESEFAKATNIIEAKRLYKKFILGSTFGLKLSKRLSVYAMFDGKPIDNEYIDLQGLSGFYLKKFETSQRRRRSKLSVKLSITDHTYTRCAKFTYLACDEKIGFFIDDMTKKIGYHGRAHLELFKDKKESDTYRFSRTLYLLKFVSEEAKNRFFAETKIPQTMFRSFEALPTPLKEATVRMGGFNRKHFTKSFICNFAQYEASGYATKSDYWDETIVDKKAGGIYVVLDRFNVCPNGIIGGEVNSYSLQKIFEGLKSKNLLPTKIYGFKKGQTLPEGNNWITLTSYITGELKKSFLNKDELLQAWLNRKVQANNFGEFVDQRKELIYSPESPIAKLYKAYDFIMRLRKKYKKDLEEIEKVWSEAVDRTNCSIEAQFENKYNVEELFNDIKSLYPLIKNWGASYNSENFESADVNEYISLIDASKNLTKP